MSKLTTEEKNRYNADDLPKIKNHLFYHYRCFIKLLFYFLFGLGAVFVSIFVFPFIRLFTLKKKDFGIVARRFISFVFRSFLGILKILRGTKIIISNKDDYKNLQGKVIVANHPSILDFVYIMSLVPNATCIVRGGLTKTPLAGVIKQAYITNTTNFDDVCVECKRLVEKGCNVIIFPEGTRTPRHGRNSYKKGAARIALFCNCNVQPIFIGGSDKYGLGKHDKLWSTNPVEQYLYDFKLLPEIDIQEFKSISEPIAAKHLTEKMETNILAAAEEYKENHPLCITINNV